MKISPGAGGTRPAAGLCTAGLCTAGLCTAALLTAWTPAAAPDTVAARGRAVKLPAPPCDLPFAQGEWGTCTTMALRLSRAPATGRTATIAVGVCAKHTGVVRARIVLPGPGGQSRPQRLCSALVSTTQAHLHDRMA